MEGRKNQVTMSVICAEVTDNDGFGEMMEIYLPKGLIGASFCVSRTYYMTDLDKAPRISQGAKAKRSKTNSGVSAICLGRVKLPYH